MLTVIFVSCIINLYDFTIYVLKKKTQNVEGRRKMRNLNGNIIFVFVH